MFIKAHLSLDLTDWANRKKPIKKPGKPGFILICRYFPG
jgi:hypothetical protein